LIFFLNTASYARKPLQDGMPVRNWYAQIIWPQSDSLRIDGLSSKDEGKWIPIQLYPGLPDWIPHVEVTGTFLRKGWSLQWKNLLLLQNDSADRSFSFLFPTTGDDQWIELIAHGPGDQS